MLWQVNRLGKKILDSKKLKYCKRCGLYYEPVLPDKCPRCSGLDDNELLHLIEKRSKTRLIIGRFMLYSAVVLIVFILIVNLLI